MDFSPAPSVVVRQTDDPAAPDDNPTPHHGEIASSLSRALRLSPAQKAQMRAVVAAACTPLDALGRQERADSALAMEQWQREIRPFLRAEQQRRFDALLALRGA